MARIALTTLGCKVNQADTARLASQFHGRGYDIVEFGDVADAYVVNTCTVTHQADKKARQLFRQAKRANPSAIVVATGCYASIAPAELDAMPEVDVVASNHDKGQVIDEIERHLAHHDILPHEFHLDDSTTALLPPGAQRTRAFVKIGDGCNKFCSFCIVPFARGRERHSHPEWVIEQVQSYVEAGYQEIVLTAVHMGSYGRGLRRPDVTLRSLVEMILAETSVRRLRLSSIEPEDFDPDMLALWKDRRLCRHLHLALQSGCDATLARMRRQYDTAHFRSTVEAIKSGTPEMAITTDLIVGFPGETDAEFETSLAFVAEMGFSESHVFRFSARKGTRAATLPEQVDHETKKARSEAMLALTRDSTRRHRQSLLGGTVEVLFEIGGSSAGDGHWAGLTDTHVRVETRSTEVLANRIVPVRPVELAPAGVRGVVEPN
jgi:threonylcarbamoyladenosine tRNA methylthiotransferase MtaB